MFRQGGWAVPLSCDDPALLRWLRWVERFATLLGLPYDAQTALDLTHCSSRWSPLAICAAVCFVGFIGLVLLLGTLKSFVRWQTTRKGSTHVAKATAAAAELRKAERTLYPSVPHSWYRLEKVQLQTPLVCSVCFEQLEPEAFLARVDCCEVCGAMAHDSCTRKVPDDCRPVAEAGEKLVHQWRPAGTVRHDREDDLGEGMVLSCLYCQSPCEADLFAMEPTWQCTWCQVLAHVRCYQQYHTSSNAQPDGGSPRISARGHSSEAADHSDCAEAHDHGASTCTHDHGVSACTHDDGKPDLQQNGHALNGVIKENGNEASSTSDEDHHEASAGAKGKWEQGKKPSRRRTSGDKSTPKAQPARSSSTPRLSLDSLTDAPKVHYPPRTESRDRSNGAGLGASGRVARRVSSLSSVFGLLASAVGATSKSNVELAVDSDEDSLQFSAEDVAKLDTCGYGAHRRLVLPPTAVRLLPSQSWSSRAKSFLRAATKTTRKRSVDLASSALSSTANTPTSLQHQLKLSRPSSNGPVQMDLDTAASSNSIDGEGRQERAGPGVGSAPGAEGAGGTQKRAGWWSQAQMQWDNYSIEEVPAGWRPLLVFINTKSGPQIGNRMRRRFLRVLNPLQVVELPREDPERALLFFAQVPNLQVLVLGGDGTVGWILSALDSLQTSCSELPEHWAPPAVAVLPLGTGNDMARVLNWGSTAAFSQRSILSTLHEIDHAIVTLLDRWDVRIDPTPPSSRGLQRTMSNASSKKADMTHKVMNNYMGIGVDAKVSLEFHTFREQFPDWFRSQIGNKLWYTGMGAKDIIGQSSQQLSKKLVVECDGQPLELAADIEGLLIINIPSYMGGVNLWASSATSPSRRRFAPQAFSDGMLELVAVYGSWHLGQLQVGLSRAIRLAQCSKLVITARQPFPVQIDGEPWRQAPATLHISVRKQAFMLRKVESEPIAKVTHVVADTLERCVRQGVISPAQRHALTAELATALNPVL